MRLLHTADWHLGRSFFGVPLIDDQAYVLDQFVRLADDFHPDAVIVAGDVYDRAVPPADAVKLLDEVLCRLILDCKLTVLLVAGNHDNPLRLEFAARLMDTLRLHIFGSLSERIRAIDMFDQWGRVCIYPMPFAEPTQVASYFGCQGLATQEDAVRHWMTVFRSNLSPQSRTVLIGHAFVNGGNESESERPIDVGGAGAVPESCFDGFDYVALGHLHRSQSLGQNQQIHYPGSLLKYSFSEAEHVKAVNLVEMGATGHVDLRSVSLVPKHDVRCVEGTIAELLGQAIELGNHEDYLQVRLLDHGAVFDAMGRLRDMLPNLLSIDHAGLSTNKPAAPSGDFRTRDIQALFSDFYAFAAGQALTEEQQKAFAAFLNRMREEERQE